MTLPAVPVGQSPEDKFREYLASRARPQRYTDKQRDLVRHVFAQHNHFDADNLIDELKTAGLRVSRATVYRTLSHLQDAGILKQVFFDNKQSYYEVIVGRQTYDYLICVETGRVIEFNSEKLRKLRDEICRQHGFEPISHQFHIFGASIEGRAKRQAREEA